MKKFNSCMEIFFRCLVAKSHQRYIAEQCTTGGKHLARYTTIRNFPDTWAMLSTCSCKHLRCKFDVIISRMIWVIHRRCSRTTLLSIGDAMAMFSPVLYLLHHAAIRQQNTSDLFFIHDLIWQPHGIWFHGKSLQLLHALHKAHT